MTEKIAVIGGSGFIGTELCKILEREGRDFKILDIAPSAAFPHKREDVDVRDKAKLSAALKGCTLIYHLAAEHRDDVQPIQKYYDVNVGGAEHIIAAAREHDIKDIIFTSSVAVYGLNSGVSTEASKPAPFNDYGQSKLDSEVVFAPWAMEDRSRKLVMARLVATFGKGNRGNIFNLINQVVGGKFIMIGNGKNKKSIAYVGNVAAFLRHCETFDRGMHIYNYADKPDMDMNKFVGEVRKNIGKSGLGPRLPYVLGMIGGTAFDVLAKLTGKNFPISKIRVEKFCADTVVSADKAHASGFTAPYKMEDGLKEMIEAEFPKQPSCCGHAH